MDRPPHTFLSEPPMYCAGVERAMPEVHLEERHLERRLSEWRRRSRRNKEPQSEPAKEPQPESPLLSREKKKNPLSFRGVANMAAKVKSAAHLSAELDRTKSERIVSGGDPSKGHNWQIRHGRMTFTGNAAARLPHPTAPLALVLSSPLP